MDRTSQFRYKLSNNRGFTLVELITAITLVVIVITAAFSLMTFGTQMQTKHLTEYEIQASLRSVSDTINQTTRYSSAVFTVPRSSFREDNLDDNWSYIGVLNNNVVKYEFHMNPDGTSEHIETILAQSTPDITYTLTFNTGNGVSSDKIVGFTIKGFITGNPIHYDPVTGQPIGDVSIDTQLELLNSWQIEYKGTPTDPAVAVAYRLESRTDPVINSILPVAQVALVLDTSGSMNDNMSGGSPDRERDRRIYIMRNSAKDLVEQFGATGYPTYISLVPFETSANNPIGFRNVLTHKTDIKNDIGALTANGGTNTGDGLRRAYHQIIEGRGNTDFVGRTVTDYIIILVDGVTTFGTRTGTSSSDPFRVDNLNVPRPWPYYEERRGRSGHIHGNGSSWSDTGRAYNAAIGDLIVADGNIKTYVIGFSADPDDLDGCEEIADQTNAIPTATGLPYFTAANQDELAFVFGEIQTQILSDLWYIDGPEID